MNSIETVIIKLCVYVDCVDECYSLSVPIMQMPSREL